MSAAGSRLGTSSSYLGANNGFGLGVGATSTPPPHATTLVTQEAVEVLGAAPSSVQITQDTIEALGAAPSGVQVTQDTIEVLGAPAANYRLSQEALEALIRTNPNLRLTQEAIEALIRTNPTLRLSQEALEVLLVETGNARFTQAPVEIVYSADPTMRLTQAPVEVVYVINRNIIVPAGRTAGARTRDPVIQVIGNALVTPVGPARAVAISVPGPKWSVAVFGALAQATAIAPPVPDPSYDIRPGRKIARARIHNPWLGAPFNASDNFANAVVIPSSQFPYMVRGNTNGFTTEPGEPVPSAGVTGSTGWYTFTAPTTGWYQVSLFNSDYDTMLAVYRQGGTGIQDLQEMGSNNNVGGTASSNVFVFLTAGTQYWIQIGGPAGSSGTFELRIQAESTTCQPVQCGGSVTANFWSGWSGGFSPSVVGGFGGFPEVARARCPSNWIGISTQLTLDSSSNPGAAWYVAWEIRDQFNGLLGGRGGFFTGPSDGITSWQVKSVTGVGGTVDTGANYSPGFGGDTARAYWYVIFAFPITPAYGILVGTMHGVARFSGVCPLPPDILPPPTPGVSGPSNLWWA